MIHKDASRTPPKSSDSSGPQSEPLRTLPEIYVSFEKVRAHVAQWLAERDRMAKAVAEYETLKSARPPVVTKAKDGDET